MASQFPSPLCIEAPAVHTHSAIILHGLGSNGPKFGEEFLLVKSASGQTLQEIFPGMKFIFPTARRTRSTIFKRAKVNQWFNIASLDDKTEREELELDGLAESSKFIRGLIQIEIDNGTPERNIILGGLSQGLAASIYTLLTLDQTVQLGAYIGMSGFFPLVRHVERIMREQNDEQDGEDDIFGSEDDAEHDIFESNNEEAMAQPQLDRPAEAIEFLRDNIDRPSLTSSDVGCLKVPVFLGHGELDEKVPISTGERVRDALKSLGMDVTWKQYEDLGHWYKSPEEIDDIVAFIKQHLAFDSS